MTRADSLVTGIRNTADRATIKMEERVSRVLNELQYGSFTLTDEEASQGVAESFFL